MTSNAAERSAHTARPVPIAGQGGRGGRPARQAAGHRGHRSVRDLRAVPGELPARRWKQAMRCSLPPKQQLSSRSDSRLPTRRWPSRACSAHPTPGDPRPDLSPRPASALHVSSQRAFVTHQRLRTSKEIPNLAPSCLLRHSSVSHVQPCRAALPPAPAGLPPGSSGQAQRGARGRPAPWGASETCPWYLLCEAGSPSKPARSWQREGEVGGQRELQPGSPGKAGWPGGSRGRGSPGRQRSTAFGGLIHQTHHCPFLCLLVCCFFFFFTRERRCFGTLRTAWKTERPAVPWGPRLFQDLTLCPSTRSMPGPCSPVTAENLEHQAAVNTSNSQYH